MEARVATNLVDDFSMEFNGEMNNLKNARKINRCPRSHRFLDCCGKNQYFEKQDALAVVVSHLRKIVYSTITTYWCVHHSCFHNGKDRWMSNSEAMLRSAQLAWINTVSNSNVS